MPQARRRTVRTRWFAFLMTLSLLPICALPAQAAVPHLDDIRVSLFIAQRGSVPAVTLSSPQGLTIGDRLADGPHVWTTVPQSARFSADQYAVLAAETPDAAAAATLAGKLDDLGYEGVVFTGAAGNYRVMAVSFYSLDDANAAKQRIAASAGATAAKVVGHYRVQAGSYASASAASAVLNAARQAGLPADLAIYDDGKGKAVYTVVAGEAIDASSRQSLLGQAQKLVPGAGWSAVPQDEPYAIAETEVAGGQSVPHYRYNPDGAKLWVTSSGRIAVKERYGRTYRGAMEISQYQGKLALINQLPLEPYLYSVVGSEMGANWPLEALKAQAVAARTYALANGMKYGIAHISDTTYDQAYKGTGTESPATIQAVDATKGEVIADAGGKLIVPYYTSNAGGKTSDISEAWGTTSATYIHSVPSPDEDAAKDKPVWYRIQLQNGQIGYIRSDFATDTGDKNPAGLPIFSAVGSGVNIRQAPYVDDAGNPAIAQVNRGDRFVVIGQDTESNAYTWIRGPYGGDELLKAINARASAPVAGPLATLEITKRGPSERVIEIRANGQPVAVSNPDSLRGALNGLPSTRFDVENTADVSILGAGGGARTLPQAGTALYAAGSGGAAAPVTGDSYFVMNADRDVRAATFAPSFRFVGFGFGHGIGMSQWGARGWADLGYDYRKILLYYYKDVQIVKG